MKRYNDTFEDVFEAGQREEAEAFFRNVDRYDRLRGPIRKLTTGLRDLCSTLVPSIDLRWERATSLEEGHAEPTHPV
jgi:hypothetical protein